MNINLKKSDDLSLKFFYVFTFVSFFFLIFTFSCAKIYNFDILWHLKTGYLILLNKSFFTIDPYCGYLVQAKWFNFHELFQILIAFVHSFFGFSGLSILKCIMVLAIYSLTFKKKEYSVTFLIFIFISILGFSKRVMLRPELLSYLYLILLLQLILHYKKNTNLKIFFIFIIQVFMSISHSIFLIGPVLLILKLISELFAKKWNEVVFWLKAFLISVFASSLNSQGIYGLFFPLKLFTKVAGRGDFFKDNVLEFASHDFFDTSNLFKTIYILLVLIVILHSLFKKQLFHLFVLSSFAYLAVSAERNFNLFVCVSLPIISSSCFTDYIDAKLNSLFIKKLILTVLISLSFLYGILFMSNKIYRKENRLQRFGIGLSEITFSDRLNHFLKTLPNDAKIFNTMSLGGYIIFFNYPLKVFYDGRLDVYGIDYFKRYLKMISDIDFFKKTADELNIDYVVLNHSINESKVLMNLYKEPSWRVVFLDYYAVVFARKHIADTMEISNNFKVLLSNLTDKIFYNGDVLHEDDSIILNECFKIAVSDMES